MTAVLPSAKRRNDSIKSGYSSLPELGLETNYEEWTYQMQISGYAWESIE